MVGWVMLSTPAGKSQGGISACASKQIQSASQHNHTWPEGHQVIAHACEGPPPSIHRLGFLSLTNLLMYAVYLQLYNKWSDDSDSIFGSCRLPLQQVADLAVVDHPQGSSSSISLRTFLLEVKLEPNSCEARVQPAGRVALLQVNVSYTASNCYSLEDEDGNPFSGEEGGERDVDGGEGGRDASPRVSDQSIGNVHQQPQQQGAENQQFADQHLPAGTGEVQELQEQRESSCREAMSSGGEDDTLSDVIEGLNDTDSAHDALWHASAMQKAGSSIRASQDCLQHMAGNRPHASAEEPCKEAPVDTPLQLKPFLERQQASSETEPASVTAELSVEVIRAAGLQVRTIGWC